MEKSRGKTLVRSVARSSSQGRGLPREVASLIKGRTAELSTASKYWKKTWEIVKMRVPHKWSSKGGHRYELRAPFFRCFMEILKQVIKQRYPRPEMNAADVIARALYDAAHLYPRPQLPPLESGYDRLWPADRPISEAWRRLGTRPGPGGTIAILEDPGSDAKLLIYRPRQHNFPRVRLRTTWSDDRNQLPKLTIEVEGEPVAVLMKACYNLRDPEERRESRKEAKRIWQSLNEWISRDLGVEHGKKGRPGLHLGGNAAYLHDHHGRSWRQVAEQLCPEKHRHGSACIHNLRMQAAQFWDLMRKRAVSQPTPKM